MLPPQIQTARLLLRPFRLSDVDDALAYRNDPEFARYLPHIPQPFSRQDAQAFVETNLSEPWEVSPVFAVTLGGRVIGTVNFEVGAGTHTAMVGYAIGRDWWGQGLAYEAVEAAMAWAVKAFGLERVWAACDPSNTRSIRLMKRLGMTLESIREDGQPVFAMTLQADSS